jgi:opacity protein-like surface antigen
MHRQRLLLMTLFALLASAAQAAPTVENIRIWAEGGKTVTDVRYAGFHRRSQTDSQRAQS